MNVHSGQFEQALLDVAASATAQRIGDVPPVVLELVVEWRLVPRRQSEQEKLIRVND